MKKLLLSLAAVAAVGAAAAPAAAQTWAGYQHYGYDRDGYGRGYGQDYRAYSGSMRDDPRFARLDEKIMRAGREGRLPWSETESLARQLRSVWPIAWRAQHGQGGGWEEARVDRTLSRIEQTVDRASGYGYGYGYGGGRDGWRGGWR